VLHGDVARHAEHECRFSHGRPGRHDHHVAALPAGGEPVQFHEAGGHAAHAAGLALGVLDVGDGVLDQVAHRLVVALEVAAGDGVEVLFGLVEQVEDVGAVVVGVAGGLGADADQFAQDVLLADDARVVLHVGAAGHLAGELADVEGAAHHVQLPALLELLGDGEDVDGLIILEEVEDGAEDALVRLHIEAFGLQDVDGLVHRVALQHERAQHSNSGACGGSLPASSALASKAEESRRGPPRKRPCAREVEKSLIVLYVDACARWFGVVAVRSGACVEGRQK